MAHDLTDLLAEGAPDHVELPDLALIEARVTRRRTARAGVVALAVLAAVGLSTQLIPDTPDRPIITEPDTVRPTESATVPDAAPARDGGSNDHLDISALGPLGEAGLAVETARGLELFTLDGVPLGALKLTLPDFDPFGMTGGPLRAWSEDWNRHVWVDPTTGQVVTGDGFVPLAGGEALVQESDSSWQLVGATYDGTQPAVAPHSTPRIGMSGALVTTADCMFSKQGCEPAMVIDLDAVGVSDAPTGCVSADKHGDGATVNVCQDTTGGSWLLLPDDDASGSLRVEMIRESTRPGESSRYTDAVFGGPGLVVQLSTVGSDAACDHRVTVGFQDGQPVGLFGGAWDDELFESHLLGLIGGTGGRTAVVRVPARPSCGGPPTITPGVYAIDADGPRLLNELDGAMALWGSFGPDLHASAQTVIDSYEPLAELPADGTAMMHVSNADGSAVTGRLAAIGEPLTSKLRTALETGWPFGLEDFEGTVPVGDVRSVPAEPGLRAEVSRDWELWEQLPLGEISSYIDELGWEYVPFSVTTRGGVIVEMRQHLES